LRCGTLTGCAEVVLATDMFVPCTAVPQTGQSDTVLGREDGSLEVWDVDRQGQPPV
jgi:hypothetical protein